ncbi:AAA family ATPase [Faecalibacter macacae]|uniref:MoxR family ATPase n=1 Tax=Faecalibacter macacae TaxID=1859289 RepID=A0A3L9MF40_9FLAO|nr:MoxR family ATPase [Faecalibacter macacae]RLZ11402.1 MoxR family ATPase [Faecalibacter macacae]
MSTPDKFMPFENRIDVSDIQTKVVEIKRELRKVIVGQEDVINQLVIALLSNGHSLIEGLPGVAKTMMAKLLAKTIQSDFSRIQFTPDLMPSDVTGSSVLNMQTNEFEFKKGPIFSNIILIDEINRSPAKTQAALFECMSENQVTVDGTTYKLSPPFLVFATQNPIEQEGTYRLPEAQLDRFMFKINVDYPELEDEITLLTEQQERKNINKESLIEVVISGQMITEFQDRIKSIFVHSDIIKFIATLVFQTRTDQNLYIGASPRASIALLDAAKTAAAIDGRDFVIPEDVKNVAYAILGHRVVLMPEKEMEGYSTENIIQQIIDRVEIPR